MVMNDLIQLTDDELKALQKKNLEIAEYFVRFCKIHNLRVYVFAGACLGTIRHKGLSLGMMILICVCLHQTIRNYWKYGGERPIQNDIHFVSKDGTIMIIISQNQSGIIIQLL